MSVIHPKSIVQLVIIGFALVLAPLILVLVNISISVDDLASQGERALLQTADITQNSRILVERITDMERSARQYEVLGDSDLYDVFHNNHTKFLESINTLSKFQLEASQKILIEQLRSYEEETFKRVTISRLAKDGQKPELLFQRLRKMGASLLDHNQELIDKEVASTQAAASEMQSKLYWQVIALAPVVIILVAVFITLIVKPIRQMDRAIRQLGDQDFSREIKLTGPRDFENLGERLDWLRIRLSEVEEQKKKFLRHISHELKTPLTSIREGAELLSDEVAGSLNPKQKKIINILRENSIHLQRLIEDLLNYNNVTRNMAEIYLMPQSVDELLNEVINEHKMELLLRQIRLDKRVQPIIACVDKEKLKIVMDNLFSNACKFSPHGGEIKVSLELNKELIELVVEDEGPGIPEQEREQIFEAFYQGEIQNSSHVEGSGLGLAIAREYIKAHNGTIEAVSKNGQGACFIVKVPYFKLEDVA
jgi:two-component system sensor histidine kinase GlrK